MKKVKVIFADGSIGEVEETDLNDALSNGAKRYDEGQQQKSTSMVFPDGSIADIADSDVNDAMSVGAKKKVGENGIGTPADVNTSTNGSAQSTSPLPSPEDSVVDNIYKKFPGLRVLGDVSFKADTNFTSKNTGVGSIEYFSPEQDSIKYNNGFTVAHPKKGTHGILYNPNTNDEQSIMLDMLHGMKNASPEYAKYRDELKNVLLKNNPNDGDLKESIKYSGQKEGTENWVDGVIRNLMFEGTPDEMKKARYWDKAKETYLKDPKAKEAFNGLRKQIIEPPLSPEGSSLITPASKAFDVSSVLPPVVQQIESPVVKYNNAKTFLSQDIDETYQKSQDAKAVNGVLPPGAIPSIFNTTNVLEQPDPNKIKQQVTDENDEDVADKIPSIEYVNQRKQQIDLQILDLKNQQYIPVNGDPFNTLPAPNSHEIQVKIDSLNEYKNNLVSHTDPIAKVQVYKSILAKPDKNNNPYLSMGLKYTALQNPIEVENKQKNIDTGADNLRNKDLVSMENYSYEAQGIQMAKDAAEILKADGKIDENIYNGQIADANLRQSQLELKYPEVRTQRIKSALGQIIDRNRQAGEAASDATTGVPIGSMKSLIENIISAAPSQNEIKDAVKELNDNGANITEAEAKNFIHNSPDIGNTAIIGRTVGGLANLANKIAIGAGLEDKITYENVQQVVAKDFANTPRKATEQPQTIISTGKGEDFLKPAQNPLAGLHNWGWGTVNMVADGVGMLGKLAILTDVTGGLADAALGEVAGAEVVGYGLNNAGKIVEQTALSAAQKQTFGTMAGMYIDTYQDAYDASKQFIGEKEGGEAARQSYATLMGGLTGAAWTILPATKVFNDIVGSSLETGAKNFAELIPKEGLKGLKEASVKDFFVNTLTETAKAQGKMEAISGITQVAQFATQSAFNPQSVESRNLGQEVVDGAIQGLSFLPITLFEGRGLAKKISNINSLQKDAIFRIADDPAAFKDYTDRQVANGKISQLEADTKIKLINTAADVKREVPEDLTKPEKVEYASNLLFARKLEAENKSIKDASQIERNDKKIEELKKANDNILDNSTGAIPDVPKEKSPDELLIKAKDVVNSDVVKGFSAEPLKDAANNNPEEFKNYLSEIAQQAHDENSAKATVGTYGQELVDVATELFPKTIINEQTTKTQTQEEAASGQTEANTTAAEEKIVEPSVSVNKNNNDRAKEIIELDVNNVGSVEEVTDREFRQYDVFYTDNDSLVGKQFIVKKKNKEAGVADRQIKFEKRPDFERRTFDEPPPKRSDFSETQNFIDAHSRWKSKKDAFEKGEPIREKLHNERVAKEKEINTRYDEKQKSSSPSVSIENKNVEKPEFLRKGDKGFFDRRLHDEKMEAINGSDVSDDKKHELKINATTESLESLKEDNPEVYKKLFGEKSEKVVAIEYHLEDDPNLNKSIDYKNIESGSKTSPKRTAAHLTDMSSVEYAKFKENVDYALNDLEAEKRNKITYDEEKPTVGNEVVEKEIKKINDERDAEIKKIGKPDLKMQFVSAKELVDSKDPIGNKEKHNVIKEKFKELKKIFDCL